MRVIKVQIATDYRFKATTLLDWVEAALQDRTGLGPLSISTGVALFEDSREVEATITIHEGTPYLALLVWELMREHIPGVDCGRIYDRNLSWCAKVYAKKYYPVRYGPDMWPDCTSEPVEC